MLKAGPLDLLHGGAVTCKHMHPRHENVSFEIRGFFKLHDQRLNFAKVGTGARKKKNFS
jgi:hypothetical protein